jgi:hypothetical protein
MSTQPRVEIMKCILTEMFGEEVWEAEQRRYEEFSREFDEKYKVEEDFFDENEVIKGDVF